MYDGNGYVKVRRNIVFNVVDFKKNIFIGKVLFLFIEGDKDFYLNDFLNIFYVVSYFIFY